jgi:hypothetical protein
MDRILRLKISALSQRETPSDFQETRRFSRVTSMTWNLLFKASTSSFDHSQVNPFSSQSHPPERSGIYSPMNYRVHFLNHDGTGETFDLPIVKFVWFMIAPYLTIRDSKKMTATRRHSKSRPLASGRINPAILLRKRTNRTLAFQVQFPLQIHSFDHYSSIILEEYSIHSDPES